MGQCAVCIQSFFLLKLVFWLLFTIHISTNDVIYGFFHSSHNYNSLIYYRDSNKLLNIFFFYSLISQISSKSLSWCSIDTLYACREVSDLHVWAGNIIQFWSLFSNLHNLSRSPCCSTMVILIPSLTSHGRPCSIIVINWLTALIDPTNPSSALMSMF